MYSLHNGVALLHKYTSTERQRSRPNPSLDFVYLLRRVGFLLKLFVETIVIVFLLLLCDPPLKQLLLLLFLGLGQTTVIVCCVVTWYLHVTRFIRFIRFKKLFTRVFL